MQLRYEQLSRHLEGDKPLASIYLISGEEFFLVQTACDAIRNSAKKQGFSERVVFHAEPGFNWQTLLSHSNNYGLFAKKQLFELHLLQDISEAAAQTIKIYTGNPPSDKILLIIAGKIDRQQLKTAWFKSIDKTGVFIPIWPLELSQLTTWVISRLSSLGLTAENDALQSLIFATEGNLLATAQEIEKLCLYFNSNANKMITRDALEQALSDNARFDPFKLSDAALLGKPKRCLRILNRLKEEGIEPLLILWTLSRECRQLASIAFQLYKGQNLKTLFQIHHIWEKRQHIYQQALQRQPLIHWYNLLRFAARCDRIIKGVESGNSWRALQQLSITLAGEKIEC